MLKLFIKFTHLSRYAAISEKSSPGAYYMRPTSTQKILSTVYAGSFFKMAHHESRMASIVLKTHTNMNGLCGPSQLTRLKLKMRMITPIISMTRIFFKTKALRAFICNYYKPGRYFSCRLSM